MQKLVQVKADTAHGAAKEKRDDQAGRTGAVCVQAAKTTRTKALADLTVAKEVTSAGKAAMDDRRAAALPLDQKRWRNPTS